jgi:hypothetical protein
MGGGALVVALLLGFWIADRSHMKVRSTQSAPTPRDAGVGGRTRVSPRLPAPQLPRHSTEPAPAENSPVPLLQQLFNGGDTNRLTPERIAGYLRENKRSAASLLAAARITGDRAFLQEAAKRFPNDPRVLLDVLLFGTATPTERRQTLDAFCQAAPDNAMGDYLSALDHFESGDTDAAVRALWQAFSKIRMEDYALETVQDREEAYLAAGYSRVQAAAAGYFGVEIPQASRLRALSRQLLALQTQYARAGDAESAQVVAEMGVRLGTQMQMQMGNVLVEELVGMAIERGSLERLDPNAILEATGQTVGERLQELEQRKNTIKTLGAIDLTKFDERDIGNFIERAKLYGEFSALQWLQNKYGTGGATP